MSKQTCRLPLLSGRAVPFLGRHERRVKLGAIRRRLQHHIMRVSRQCDATDDCAMEPQYHVQIVVHVQIWLTCLGHVQWVRSRVITEERHTPGLPRSAACPHAGRMQLTQNDSASSSLADMRNPCLAVAAGSSGATCSAWCRQHVTSRPFVHSTNCRSAGANHAVRAVHSHLLPECLGYDGQSDAFELVPDISRHCVPAAEQSRYVMVYTL